MKRKMPKVLLVLALMCVLALGAAVAAFGDTAGNTGVTGNGSWYYEITVDEATGTDATDYVEFWVELCDENGDWLTTTTYGDYWVYDEDWSLSWDWWDISNGTWNSPEAGDTVIVEIVRDDDNIAVSYYINHVLSYGVKLVGGTFTDTVNWQVNIQAGSVNVSDLKEGGPETEARTITNVEVKSLSQSEFIVGSEFDLAGTVLTVTYANGDTAELTVGQDDWWTYDAYDNGIEIYGETEVEDEEEGYTWTDTTWPNNPIYSVGTYTVVIETESYDFVNYWTYGYYTTDTTFTVREATTEDVASAVALVLDETYDVTTADQWFSYTPTESGYYVFKTTDGYASNYNNYVSLYVDWGDGTLAFWTNDWYSSDGITFRWYLEAGYTYYYRTIDYYGEVTAYQVTFIEGKTVVSFTVDSLGKTEFTQYIGRLDLSGSVLTVTYTDGTTATLTIDKGYEAVDEYGNCFYYRVTDYVEGSEDYDYDYWYEYGSYIYLDPGTYTVTFLTYDAYDKDEGYFTYTDTTQSITVVALEDSSDVVVIELLDEEYPAEIASSDRVWYSYTPAVDGEYYLIENWDVDEDIYYNDCWYNTPCIIDENGNYTYVETVEIYDEETDNWYVAYVMEAGKTYYIRADYYAYDEDWNNVADASATVTFTMMQVDHEHSYTNEAVIFDWADDYSTATASLRCDTCSHIETTVDCTVTSVTTAATTEAEGSIVYTATAVINGVTYTDTITVVIEKLADTSSETGTETETDSETETTTDTSSTATSTSTDADSTDNSVPVTGDVSTWGYYVLLIGAAAAAFVLAKKKVNA